MNGDFKHDLNNETNNGAFHQLSTEMHDSLLRFALKSDPEVRKSEEAAMNKQQNAKDRKKNAPRKKKIVAAQTKYANVLTYIEMYHSPACWKTVS